jgi:K+-sensing histidine kinase KdpD
LGGVLNSDNKGDKNLLHSKEIMVALSHDLRAPLAVVKESISLVLDGVPGAINEKQKKLLTVARNNIDKLVTMMDTLLEEAKRGGSRDGKKGAEE